MTWLETIAFPTLFPQSEYNGERLHWRYRQYTAGLANFRVGPPRLRQVKVIQGQFIARKIYNNMSYSIILSIMFFIMYFR